MKLSLLHHRRCAFFSVMLPLVHFKTTYSSLNALQVPLQVLRDAMCDLSMEGSGRYRNIMITGNANCGKTFLLNPLTLIFNTFCSPASGSFAWVGVQNAECIFLTIFGGRHKIYHGMICYLC